VCLLQWAVKRQNSTSNQFCLGRWFAEIRGTCRIPDLDHNQFSEPLLLLYRIDLIFGRAKASKPLTKRYNSKTASVDRHGKRVCGQSDLGCHLININSYEEFILTNTYHLGIINWMQNDWQADSV
jgi:hypothetical protein